MSITEIEALQAIVNDETRPAEERKAAAEHILQLQGETPAPITAADITTEDREHYARFVTYCRAHQTDPGTLAQHMEIRRLLKLVLNE